MHLRVQPLHTSPHAMRYVRLTVCHAAYQVLDPTIRVRLPVSAGGELERTRSELPRPVSWVVGTLLVVPEEQAVLHSKARTGGQNVSLGIENTC